MPPYKISFVTDFETAINWIAFGENGTGWTYALVEDLRLGTEQRKLEILENREQIKAEDMGKIDLAKDILLRAIQRGKIKVYEDTLTRGVVKVNVENGSSVTYEDGYLSDGNSYWQRVFVDCNDLAESIPIAVKFVNLDGEMSGAAALYLEENLNSNDVSSVVDKNDPRAQARDWLESQMRADPEMTLKPKAQYKSEAIKKFGVSNRAFESAWDVALEQTGARWDRPGRKRKPLHDFEPKG